MSLATLSSYSREQLSDILRILKLYKTGLVQIGHRAHLQDPKADIVVRIRVEYPKGASLEEIRSFALSSITTYFPSVGAPDNIVFAESSTLIGGIRIFAGDDMIDVSFQRFANQIKN